MTYQLSRWSVIALFPALAFLNCTEPGSTDLEENGSEKFRDLSDSKFENDGNLKDDPQNPLTLDWANVMQAPGVDAPTGKNDSSYKGGAKEDDACPAVGTGSIPNNKSDLVNFGVYHEEGAGFGDLGFLHLLWTRVQDPSGTTLMDFEFNQSQDQCDEGSNNPHKERTAGDVLLEYRLEQGGAFATLQKRTWEGSNWSGAVPLGDDAVGTINLIEIPADESDGLGELDPRTFGEASIDLKAIFEDDVCQSFGSATVKSRSSDAFDSALKDYIPPVPVNISNCAPLTDMLCEVEPQVSGATSSTIRCEQVLPEEDAEVYPVEVSNEAGFADFERLGLLPGTYTCEVVITAD
jgi:hypothetical protein